MNQPLRDQLAQHGDTARRINSGEASSRQTIARVKDDPEGRWKSPVSSRAIADRKKFARIAGDSGNDVA